MRSSQRVARARPEILRKVIDHRGTGSSAILCPAMAGFAGKMIDSPRQSMVREAIEAMFPAPTKTQRCDIAQRYADEWDGVEHVITVLKDGLDWQGRRYKSLSAVARDITGGMVTASLACVKTRGPRHD